MARPLVIVQGLRDEDARALTARWQREVPELELEPARDARALLKALESRRAAAVIVRASVDASMSTAVIEVSRKYPSTALLVLECEDDRCIQANGQPCDDEDRAALLFLREDVLKAARGSLSGVALPSVLQVLQCEQRTCTLRVRQGRKLGALVVRNGTLFHAEFRSLAPKAAALEMLAWTNADVIFEPAPTMIAATIDAPLDYLLLEAARIDDERANGGGRAESVFPPTALSASNWSMPAALKDGGAALVDELMRIPGAQSVELIDVGSRQLLANRSPHGDVCASPERISAIVRAVYDIVADMESRDRMEEVIVHLSTRFKVIRAFRGEPNLVICAAFVRTEITLGLAKTMVGQAMDAFSLSAAVSEA
jgi:hypothetical protein